eukprot:scaffold1122_cov377-Prasinococcus_capsulatus_cf.AAC.3
MSGLDFRTPLCWRPSHQKAVARMCSGIRNRGATVSGRAVAWMSLSVNRKSVSVWAAKMSTKGQSGAVFGSTPRAALWACARYTYRFVRGGGTAVPSQRLASHGKRAREELTLKHLPAKDHGPQSVVHRKPSSLSIASRASRSCHTWPQGPDPTKHVHETRGRCSRAHAA